MILYLNLTRFPLEKQKRQKEKLRMNNNEKTKKVS